MGSQYLHVRIARGGIHPLVPKRLARLAVKSVARHAQHPLHVGRDVGEAKIRVYFPEPVGRGLGEIVNPLFAFAQGLEGLDLLGHVDEGRLDGRAAIPFHDAVDRLQPKHRSVLAQVTAGVARRGGLAALPRVAIARQAFAVFRRHDLAYRVRGEDLARVVVAEHLGQRLVEKQGLPVSMNEHPLDRALDQVSVLLLACAKCLFGLLALCDVHRDGANRGNLSSRVEEGKLNRQKGVVAVVEGYDLFPLDDPALAQNQVVVFAQRARDLGRKEVPRRLAPNRFSVDVVELFELAIDDHVAAVPVLDRHLERRMIHEGFQPRLALRQGPFPAFLLGHVDMTGHEIAVGCPMRAALEPAPGLQAVHEGGVRPVRQGHLPLQPARRRKIAALGHRRSRRAAQHLGARRPPTKHAVRERQHPPIAVVPENQAVVPVEEREGLCRVRYPQPCFLGVSKLRQERRAGPSRLHAFQERLVDDPGRCQHGQGVDHRDAGKRRVVALAQQ